MKIVEAIDVAAAGSFLRTKSWQRATADVETAIETADWPHGSGLFSLNPEPISGHDGKLDRHPNGVQPIKLPMIEHLASRGWATEALPELPVGHEGKDVLTTGDLDALLLDRNRYVGFEWETGNIASSHRAMNKLLDGMTRGTMQGGILALPMRSMQRYLTDRVGNFEELSPYFEFWARYPIEDGVLRVYGTTHDVLDPLAPHIPKGKDGRARG